MLTEEELGTAVGARLRAETADIGVRRDLIAAVRHQRARRSLATRAGLATAGAAAIAGAATALAAAPGSQPHHQPAQPAAAQHQGTGPAIRLDGYLITTPKGTQIHKVGAGYLVRGPHAASFVVFLERGLVVAREARKIQRLDGKPFHVGDLTAWWSGTTKVGELLLRSPGMPSQEFLVAKALGATKEQVLSFAAGLEVSRMHAVHVSCLRNCG